MLCVLALDASEAISEYVASDGRVGITFVPEHANLQFQYQLQSPGFVRLKQNVSVGFYLDTKKYIELKY